MFEIQQFVDSGNGKLKASIVMVRPHDLETIFAMRGWLGEQPAEFRSSFLNLSRRVEFDRGEAIAQTGDDPGGIYGIVSGSVGGWVTTDLSGPTLGHISRPGAWFGMGPAVTGRNRAATFVAMEETTVVLIPLSSLRPAMAGDPDFARRVSMLSEVMSQQVQQWACELLINDADRRVAATLLRVTAVREGVKPTVPQGFRLSQENLGEMSNTSRLQTNAILGRLKKLSLVTLSYGHIGIPDPESLADYARDEDRKKYVAD